IDIPGHDIPALLQAYQEARSTTGQPTVIITRTVKGKGVSFMENQVDWHAKLLAGAELEQARHEIAERLQTFADKG
ncbi:MAG: hypothetical protein U0703_13305, partial [Anaerolineae bacterium]